MEPLAEIRRNGYTLRGRMTTLRLANGTIVQGLAVQDIIVPMKSRVVRLDVPFRVRCDVYLSEEL